MSGSLQLLPDEMSWQCPFGVSFNVDIYLEVALSGERNLVAEIKN